MVGAAPRKNSRGWEEDKPTQGTYPTTVSRKPLQHIANQLSRKSVDDEVSTELWIDAVAQGGRVREQTDTNAKPELVLSSRWSVLHSQHCRVSSSRPADLCTNRRACLVRWGILLACRTTLEAQIVVQVQNIAPGRSRYHITLFAPLHSYSRFTSVVSSWKFKILLLQTVLNI